MPNVFSTNLEAFLGHLGYSFGHVDANLGHLGATLRHLWVTFGHLSYTLGTWGSFWGDFERLRRRFERHEGYFATILARFQKTFIFPINFNDFIELRCQLGPGVKEGLWL